MTNLQRIYLHDQNYYFLAVGCVENADNFISLKIYCTIALQEVTIADEAWSVTVYASVWTFSGNLALLFPWNHLYKHADTQ